MVIEVVSHLSHSLSCGCLVLNWHFGEACGCIEFYVAGVEDVLVVIVDFDVFVTGDTLVVITADGTALDCA